VCRFGCSFPLLNGTVYIERHGEFYAERKAAWQIKTFGMIMCFNLCDLFAALLSLFIIAVRLMLSSECFLLLFLIKSF
ncbi:unnamed protein product, partial [Brugia timori]|uniref:7TM_GPCR_Srx domain-containing protein n=1 Tax=Brugia timori TaxID=42155 RepID=A0A0R3QED8_9BILA